MGSAVKVDSVIVSFAQRDDLRLDICTTDCSSQHPDIRENMDQQKQWIRSYFVLPNYIASAIAIWRSVLS